MSQNKIFSAIPKIMSEVGAIKKTRENQQGSGYMFRGIDDVYAALQPLLHKHGVFFSPSVIESSREERQSKSGGNLIYTILRVKYIFYADDGSSFEVVVPGEAMDSGDKSSNKAMSAALKYALLQVFCIPTEEEKDTEYQSPEVHPKANAPRASASIPAQGPGRVSSSNTIASPNSQAAAGSGVFCEACQTELKLSKAGTTYYCPNFKNASQGEHTRIQTDMLEPFKNAQSMRAQNDVPF